MTFRYDPESSDGPCAHMFCTRVRAAAGDETRLGLLGDAWLKGQDMADRDAARGKVPDIVERTAEYALGIVRRDGY